MSASIPSLADAILVFVLLVPGFIAFWLARKVGLFGSKATDFNVTIWSFCFSGIILFPFTLITGLTDLDKIREHFFDPVNYSLLFALTAAIGIGFGAIYKKLFSQNRVTGDPWIIAVNHYALTGSWVKIITKTGEEYTGKYRYASEEDEERSMLINEPSQVIRDKDGTIISTYEIGKELLFTEGDIARVFFFKDWDEVTKETSNS